MVLGTAVGWRTWGDVAGDTGRELELARLLADGRRLYVDVAYYYGPIAPHLNGLLMRLFGAEVGVLVAAGLASTALAAGGLVAIVQPLAGWLAAGVTGVAFLSCCAFAHLHYANVFNWVLPYGFPSTYGMLLAIWSVERLLRHVRARRNADLWASALLLALAGLTKIEAATAALLAHGAFVIVRLAGIGTLSRATWRAYGVSLALVVAGYAIALRDDPAGLVRTNFVDVLRHPGMRRFVSHYAGADDVGGGIWRMAGSALALAVALASSLALGALARRGRLPPAFAVLGAAVGALPALWLDPASSFAALPLVAIVAVATLVLRTASGGADRSASLEELLLWTAALGCLVRMPLAAGAVHYGFYLLPLPLAAFVVWWFRTLPGWLGVHAEAVRVHRAVGMALVLAIAVAHWRVSAPMFARHTARVDAPRGSAWLLGEIDRFPLGRAYADTIAHLATYPPETRVLSVPLGSAMAFLAGLQSAGDRTGYYPPELDPSEDRLLANLAAAPPDLVVSIRLDLSEWGSRGFGVDHGRRTWAWIRAHYEPVATFGPEQLVLVLRRRAPSH
jgi:hypothetical protein